MLTQGAFVFTKSEFDGRGYGESVTDYSTILGNVVVVMEQQVGYKTGHKPGSRFQNSLESLRHQEKDIPITIVVSGTKPGTQAR